MKTFVYSKYMLVGIYEDAKTELYMFMICYVNEINGNVKSLNIISAIHYTITKLWEPSRCH